MANIYQKTALGLYEKGFGYMYGGTILWSNNYSTLSFNPCKRHVLYFKMSMFLALLTCLGSLYDVVSWTFIDRPGYNLGIATLHVMCAILMAATLLYAYVVYNNQEIVEGLNSLFEVTADLKSQIEKRKRRAPPRVMDVTIFGVATLPIPSGIVIYFSSLLFGFDPYYSVFGDLLGDPQYKNTSPWIFGLCLSIRAVFTLVAFEMARSVAFSMTRDLLIIDSMESSLGFVLKASKQPKPCVNTCVANFRKIVIPCKLLTEFQDEVVALTFSAMFWIFLFGGWVVFFGFDLVPTYMYCLIALIFFLGFPCVLCGLFVISGVKEACDEIIRCLVRASGDDYAHSKTPSDRKNKLVSVKVTRSLLSIGIRYKPIKSIDKEFPRDWSQNWVEKLFDLIVLSNV